MREIKSIKKSAKNFLKKNIWTLIVAGILITFVLGETTVANVSFNNLELSYNAFNQLVENYNLDQSKEEKENEKDEIIGTYTSNLVSQIFSGRRNSFITEYNNKNNITKGLFFDIFTIISRSRIQLNQFVNSVLNNENNTTAIAVIISVMASISLLIKILITNPLIIGERRLFLESIYYHKTKLRTLIAPFKKNKYGNAVRTVLLKNIYQVLWNVTIIGGIIKNYSYKMVTFIEAENRKY